METCFYWMMLAGGLVALVGGLTLIFFGDRLRAMDERAGRTPPPDQASPAQQRRLGMLTAGMGAACLIFAFLIS